MRKIDQLISEYGESHQNPLNKKIHWICVPLIFWSIIGMLWTIPTGLLKSLLPSIQSPYLNWACFLLVGVLVYYVTLSFRLFIGMTFVVFAFVFVTPIVERLSPISLFQFSLIVFVLAWIGQFYGHKVEGKKPSFFKDLQFLLIGPAWLMHFIYRRLGIKY